MNVTTDTAQADKKARRLRVLRREIREQLGRIDDLRFLRVVLGMCQERKVYHLTDEDRAAIEISRQQLAEGKGIPQEEVCRRIRESRCLK